MMEKDYDEKHWFFKALFILGIIIFVGAVFFFAARSNPSFSAFSFGWSWAWNIFWLLLFVWIIWCMVRWMFGWRWYGGRHWHGHGHAKSIARRRYARGEISRKQYHEIIKDLDDT
ncbi:MAG: hypothetical protein KGI06_04550 [Candidatus Micrarchaeota archaeon]|nr:hypothetical protein [Candidatus Micrarchaeota archaeon]